MLSTPSRDAAETLANAAFDALLRALSRPGTITDLPAPGEGPIATALLDRECRVHCADPTLMPKVLATGAFLTEIAEADHVFAGTPSDLAPLGKLRIGTDLYPDDGATVVVRAELGAGQRLRLTGPGVDGAVDCQIGGLPEGFWALRKSLLRYPLGFDLFVIDGARLCGVPRSTQVEVL